MRKVGNIFARELDFKDVQFPVKIGDIHKIEKKNKTCVSIGVFGYENKEKYPSMCQKILSKDILICH